MLTNTDSNTSIPSQPAPIALIRANPDLPWLNCDAKRFCCQITDKSQRAVGTNFYNFVALSATVGNLGHGLSCFIIPIPAEHRVYSPERTQPSSNQTDSNSSASSLALARSARLRARVSASLRISCASLPPAR